VLQPDLLTGDTDGSDAEGKEQYDGRERDCQLGRH
jgi:hypothetical protein